MSNVRNLDDYIADKTPHDVAELICVKCYHRWIGTWPSELWLKELSCPNCKTRGVVITTGQCLPEDE